MTTAVVTNHERSPVGERVMAGGVHRSTQPQLGAITARTATDK